MNEKLKNAFNHEISSAKGFIASKEYDQAFYHLERAHVLGQKFVSAHTLSHCYMLKVGLIRNDYKEVLGQIFRIVAGILGSTVGIVPSGNTGGSNVSAFKKMEIPHDLKRVMSEEHL